MSIRENDTQNRAVTLREFQQLDSTIFVDSGDELAAAKLGYVYVDTGALYNDFSYEIKEG